MDWDSYWGQINAGSERAFGLWMTGCEPELRRSLRSFAAVVDTEVVVQESLLRLWQVAPRLTPDGKPNTLLRYAVKTARNLAISEVRKSKNGQTLPPEETDALSLASMAPTPDPFLRARIQECVESLPPKPGAALKARLKSEGKDNDRTLAESLSMKKNTFLQNITRARQFLLLCLERAGVDLSTVGAER